MSSNPFLGPFGDAASFIENLDDLFIEEWDTIRDGGTAVVIFCASSGERFAACFDYQSTTDTRGRLYFGNTYPISRTRQPDLVPLGSTLQTAVIRVLKQHIEKNFSFEDIEAYKAECRRFREYLATLTGVSHCLSPSELLPYASTVRERCPDIHKASAFSTAIADLEALNLLSTYP